MGYRNVEEYIKERQKLAEQGFVGADGGVKVDKIKEVLKERDKLKEENEKLRQKLDWFNRELKPEASKSHQDKEAIIRGKKATISNKKATKRRQLATKKDNRIAVNFRGEQATILRQMATKIGKKATNVIHSLVDVKMLEIIYGGKQ